MPLYDYRCETCGQPFQVKHGFNESASACPHCQSVDVHRIITSAPSIARGMLTLAGDSKHATKEQLQDKWAEETPKLRKKLVDKLGEDVVNRNAPTLNHKFE
jgi:putative FmdB family regulatory protein